jgi:hypothetical protein
MQLSNQIFTNYETTGGIFCGYMVDLTVPMYYRDGANLFAPLAPLNVNKLSACQLPHDLLGDACMAY